MAAAENRFAPELNGKEVLELLQNATPGSTKRTTKYGMKIFQGKNFKTIFWQFLSTCVYSLITRSKTRQVETIYKLIKSIGYISLTSSDWFWLLGTNLI